MRLSFAALLLLACVRPGLGQSVASQPSDVRSVKDGRYISWREHIIDDEALSRVKLRGGDGVAVGDIDGDGHPDVVSVHEDSGHVRIAFGSTDPDRWVTGTLAEGRSAQAAEDVDIGDVNGDGRPDIVVACERKHVLYLEAPANPRDFDAWERVILDETRDRGSWIRVKLADMDGDGRLDIVSANKGRTNFSVFYRQGPASDSAAWKETVIGQCNTPINIQPVDLDRDGDLDVIAGSRGDRKLYFYENTGGGRSWREHIIHEGEPKATGFMLNPVDLDGDGRLDIVTQAGVGNIMWLQQPEDPRRPWPYYFLGSIAPDHPTGLLLIDLNDDGRLDLFTGGYSGDPRLKEPEKVSPDDVCGRLAWFEQPEDPKQPWKRHDISRRRRGMFDYFVTVDLNRDGLMDLVTTRGNSGNYDGVLWLEQVRTSTPAPRFQQARPKDSVEVPLPTSPTTQVSGEFKQP